METIRLRKLRPKDIMSIVIRENEAAMLSQVDRDKIFSAIHGGPAYTAVRGETVLACAGVSILWPGVGEAWVQTHPDIWKDKFWFCRKVKRMLNLIAIKHKLHRIQADVDSEWSAARRLMKYLGFRLESVMCAYGPNKENFVRYTLLLDGGRRI